MGKLIIKCHACGDTWNVKGSENFNAAAARTCPHCKKQIDRQTWRNEAVPALGLMEDLNRELYKDALAGYEDSSLFTIDYSHKEDEEIQQVSAAVFEAQNSRYNRLAKYMVSGWVCSVVALLIVIVGILLR
jgi:hypothetical protein